MWDVHLDSTLSRTVAPGFEWLGSVHFDWPHRSLRPGPSGLRTGSGHWSSCSARRSPWPPGCVTPLWSCCPPLSSPVSSRRGSPRWPHTPTRHCLSAAPLWTGAGRSGWAAALPLHQRGTQRQLILLYQHDPNWKSISLYNIRPMKTVNSWNTVICVFHFLFTKSNKSTMNTSFSCFYWSLWNETNERF